MLLSEAKKVYVGGVPAKAVYAGDTLVWPSGPSFTLDGLQIWIEGDSITEPITAWPDLSGANRYGEVIGNPLPVVRTNALNGHSVVRMTHNEGRFRWNGKSNIYKDYTIVYVARHWGPQTGRVLCASYPASGNLLFGWWTSFEDIAYGTGGGGFFLPDTRKATTTDWKLYSADCDTPAVNPRLFSNGVFLGSHPAPPAADGFGNYLNLSGYDAVDLHESCDCEVAALLAYNRKLPDAERQQVEEYLRGKYALA
jgi:hypothetical protein